MAKQKKSDKPTAVATKKSATKTQQQAQSAPAAPVAAKASAKQPVPTQTITVAKTDKKFDGARSSWYAALLAHDGKTTDEFVAACTAKPPSVPKSGKAEDPRGWLRWFVRERIAQVS